MPSFSGLPPKPGITEGNQVPFDYSDGDPGCELDGIPAPCSYLQQAKNALVAQGLYHNPDLGFRHFQFSPNLDLPGASMRFSIPSSITGRMVPDRGGSVGIWDEDSRQWMRGSDGVTGWRFQATGYTGFAAYSLREQSGTQQTQRPGSSASASKAVSDLCKRNIAAVYGDAFLEKALALMNAPPLFDIEAVPSQFDVGIGRIEDDLASRYFPTLAAGTETVGRMFDRMGWGNKANALQGYVKGLDGIYYRRSRVSFLDNPNFLFHEVVHLLQPVSGTNVDLDDEMVNDLAINVDTGMSSSSALSRFFNSGCDPTYGGVVVQ